MQKKYNWTTGPVRSSLGYDSTLIVISNGSAGSQKIQARFFDLGYTPKKLLVSENISLGPGMTTSIDTERPEVKVWEVQVSSDSREVGFWIGGRRLNYNLPGNVVLNSELQRY